MLQKYDAVSNPYREKNLTTCDFKLASNVEAHIPHGRVSGYNYCCQLVLFINTLRNSTINIRLSSRYSVNVLDRPL